MRTPRPFLTICLLGLCSALPWAQSDATAPAGVSGPAAQGVLAKFKPLKVKARGSHRVLRFEEIDRRLADLAAWLETDQAAVLDPEAPAGGPDTLRFADLFVPARPDTLFPLTNSVVRYVPESSLAGLTVFDSAGVAVGTFSNKYIYTRQGERRFTLHFFQYQTAAGTLRRTGPDLLLDRFSIRWQELADKPCLVFKPAPVPAVPAP